jgi:hypothetical protein
MKTSIIIIFSTFIFNLNIKAQVSPKFKSYECLLSSVCSKTTNGGFMTYEYCQLQFERDSVEISHRLENSISSGNDTIVDEIQVKYSWQIENNIIKIHGFNQYDPIILHKDSLTFRRRNQDITLQILE